MDLDLTDMAALATWAYLVIALVAAGDAVLPVLPAETLVILGGVLAARDELSLPVVIAVAIVGAVVGDNASYQIGHVANRKGRTPDEMSGRFGKALGWAEAALAARGPTMLIVGRFIPGGRTALTFGAGYLRYARLRFAVTTVVAASIWALYSGGIGWLGGEVFHEHWWAGLALGVAITTAMTALIELVRKVTGRTATIAEKRAELAAGRAAAAPAARSDA